MNDDGWIGTFNNTTTTNAVNEDLAIVPNFPSASNVSSVRPDWGSFRMTSVHCGISPAGIGPVTSPWGSAVGPLTWGSVLRPPARGSVVRPHT